jgi:glycosyltransferase involved in cell wall biosynthesis
MKKMRIAEVHDLWFRMPVKKYGGSERVLHPLVEKMVSRGHDVTLYAAEGTETSAKLVSVYPGAMYEDGIARSNMIYPLLNICEAIDRENEYDIIHVHLNLNYEYVSLPLAKPIKDKVVFTMHFAAPILKGYPDRDVVLRKYKDLNYISISNAQRKGMEYLNWVATVYNGIDTNEVTFNPTPKDYFMWIGKFNPDKGSKYAVEAAKKAGVKLLIAGAIDNLDGIDYKYYHEEVKPLIDNKQIVYIGEVGGEEKNKLINEAKAFLNPIQWNEPFGLVMAESMAGGTPVISFNNGAAPELVKDGETGFIVNSVDEMVARIKDIDRIDRKKCRERVEKNFSTDVMTDNYLKVFENLIQKKAA